MMDLWIVMQLEVNKSKQLKAEEGGGGVKTATGAGGKKSAKKKQLMYVVHGLGLRVGVVFGLGIATIICIL